MDVKGKDWTIKNTEEGMKEGWKGKKKKYAWQMKIERKRQKAGTNNDRTNDYIDYI